LSTSSAASSPKTNSSHFFSSEIIWHWSQSQPPRVGQARK
jgi:hypothetical protein